MAATPAPAKIILCRESNHWCSVTLDRQQFGTLLTRYKYWICIFVLTYVALVPLARAATYVEIDYNEGWNIYNADTFWHSFMGSHTNTFLPAE
jgi:hypothetical protein